jgi:hypothetical protein
MEGLANLRTCDRRISAYLTFLGRELERLYFDVLLRKHKQWFAVLRGTPIRMLSTRCELGAYQFRVFHPSKNQRLKDSLCPGAG